MPSPADDPEEGSSAVTFENAYKEDNSIMIPSADGHEETTIHRRRLQAIDMDSTLRTRHAVPEAIDEDHRSGKKFLQSFCSSAKNELFPKRSANEWVSTFLPMWKWLRIYPIKEYLPKDLVAGITVAVMVVPQSMSYAKLAGLPVQYGLYSALMPVYAYALFGSSRQLAVGPVAIVSLMLSTGLAIALGKSSSEIEQDPELQAQYNSLAIQTAFLVGVVYIVMGLLRLGFVTIFLSHAVVSGFTTGAAVIIGLSQLKYLLGYDVERSDRIYEIFHNVFKHVEDFNYKTFIMGMFAIFLLIVMKNIGKTYPRLKWLRAIGPLTVTAIGISLTWIFGLEDKGIPSVGFIPSGLPPLTVSEWFPLPHMGGLVMTVISITVVGFMESIAIAKQLASKHKYELDSSLELVGLGVANFAGAMFGAYPVTGSFSRSAVNNESGAQSGISGMVTATIVGFVLLFMTPLFEKMPLCILAAIVISGVLGLLDFEEAIFLWKVHKFDFGVWTVACLFTMTLGVEIGLGVAVVLSLLIVTYESAYPHTAVLGRLPGTNVYRNVKQYAEAIKCDGIVMVRIDAPMYFANTQNIREKIHKYVSQAEQEDDTHSSPQFLLLECTPVSHVDTTALHMLHDLFIDYKARGIQLCFSNPNMNVMTKLTVAGLVEEIGREHFYVSTHDAVNHCLQEMDQKVQSIQEREQEGASRTTADEEEGGSDTADNTSS